MPPNTWDAHPKYLIYSGQTIEMFTRGALAKALNRELVTIRGMERKGVLSHSRLKSTRGWFLYTRDQIEDLVRLAEEENVLNPSFRKTFSPRFIDEANRIIKRLPTLV